MQDKQNNSGASELLELSFHNQWITRPSKTISQSLENTDFSSFFPALEVSTAMEDVAEEEDDLEGGVGTD